MEADPLVGVLGWRTRKLGLVLCVLPLVLWRLATQIWNGRVVRLIRKRGQMGVFRAGGPSLKHPKGWAHHPLHRSFKIISTFYGNVVLDGHGEERRRIDFEVGQSRRNGSGEFLFAGLGISCRVSNPIGGRERLGDGVWPRCNEIVIIKGSEPIKSSTQRTG
jgi:hypothetical protein